MSRKSKDVPREWFDYAAGLRGYRVALGRTIEQVATDAGLHPGDLSQLERGLTIPRVRTLMAWRAALGLSPLPRMDF